MNFSYYYDEIFKIKQVLYNNINEEDFIKCKYKDFRNLEIFNLEF